MTENLVSLTFILAIGALAGWIAGLLMKGRGFGLLGNIVVGVIGAILGGFIFRLLGLPLPGLVGYLLTAVAGAVVLLFLVGVLKKT